MTGTAGSVICGGGGAGRRVGCGRLASASAASLAMISVVSSPRMGSAFRLHPREDLKSRRQIIDHAAHPGAAVAGCHQHPDGLSVTLDGGVLIFLLVLLHGPIELVLVVHAVNDAEGGGGLAAECIDLAQGAGQLVDQVGGVGDQVR